jgi:hypothetical protein
MNWQHIHDEDFAGFRIDVYAGPEDTDPRDLFDVDADEVCRDINEGRLEWFVAKVTASREGVTMGEDYLGGCCYESVRDFLQDGYYTDMVDRAVADARAKLALLKAFEDGVIEQ